MVAASLVFGLIPPATAGPGAIELSWDAKSWSPSLQGALFEPGDRWVPGETGTRTFWLRNGSADAASLRIGIDLVEDGLGVPADLKLSAQVANGPWVPVASSRDGHWLAVQRVRAHDVVRYRMRAEFGWHSTAERVAAHLTIKAALAGTDAGALDESDGRDPALPGVGTPITKATIVLGLLALGGGAALLRRRRSGGGR